MHPPHFSILREVFSYIARFLPSKRYYLFLFILVHWTSSYLFILFQVYWTLKVSFFTLHHATGISLFSWRFHLFFLHGCFIETFLYFSRVHLTPEGFLFFLQLQDAMCIYDLSPVHTGTFHGFYLFPFFYSQCHWHMNFSIILHAQDFLKVFISFPSFLQCCVITQHWGAECSIHQ